MGDSVVETENAMAKPLQQTLLAAFLAIVLTSAMDVSGYAQFSGLPLLALILLMWAVQRPGRAEWGLTLGNAAGYALALVYPIAVVGGLAVLAAAAGMTTDAVDWAAAGEEIALMTASTIVAVFITEEGFFRGSLWAGLSRAGFPLGRTLVWTAAAFMLWHVSWAVFSIEGRLPLGQVPIYLLNIFLLGLAWGLIRHISGSVLAASVSHGVWNGLVYILFGYGAGAGVLGIAPVLIFGPERGLLGVLLNAGFVALLWRRANPGR